MKIHDYLNVKGKKAVIFDCDGVLVDSEGLANVVLFDLLYRTFDTKAEVLFSYIESHRGKFAEKTALIESIAREKLPENFEDLYRMRCAETFRHHLKPIPGIRSFVESLAIPYFVASNGPMDKIRENLAITKLLPLFEGRIFSAYDFNSWKPDPGLFLNIAAKAGFLPGECVVIEDSQEGITAAIAGGFDVLAYSPHYNALLFQAMGATPFDSFL